MSDSPSATQTVCQCPNCGQSMAFSPEVQMLQCPACKSTRPLEEKENTFEVQGNDYLQTVALLTRAGETQQAETFSVNCPNCGAILEWPPEQVAGHCCYCGTAINASGTVRHVLPPEYILPFSLSKEQANEAFKQWIKKRWFLPSDLKKCASVTTPFDGVYLPYWCYDFDAYSYYTGRRGEYYYVEVEYTTEENGKKVTKTRTERRTRWYYTSGRVFNSFSNVLVPAGKSLSEDLLDELEPWDLEALRKYDADAIRGFRQELYQVQLSDAFAKTEKKTTPQIEESIRYDIGGDEQEIDTIDNRYDEIVFKHILLPVYINTFRWNNKVYQFLVNARTGEVQGERPWSIGKILLAVLIALAVIAAIVYLVNLNNA